MNEPEESEVQLIRATQIIHVSLIFGGLMLLGIGWVKEPIPKQGDPVNLYLILCFVVAGSGFLMSMVIPPLIRKNIAGVLAKRDLVTIWDLLLAIQQCHIVRMSLLEGPAILSGLFLFLNGNPIFLGIGLTLSLIMAMLFPTGGKLIEQAQALEDQVAILRQSGGG